MEKSSNNQEQVQEAQAMQPRFPVPPTTGEMMVFGSAANFEQAQRMARMLSASTIVPRQYQNTPDNPNAISNCVIALEMANRIGMSPLMVMQNLHVIYGNVGWSSKFLIAALNTCGRFSPLQYEQEGKDTPQWRCRAWAINKVTGASINGAWVSIQMAKDEGWFNKNGSKWKTMPELMLMYRAAAFFQRVYAPEISMGMQTVEELNDIVDAPYEDVTNSRPRTTGAFDVSNLRTESDINTALLRGHIDKDEAEVLKQSLVRKDAAQNIAHAAAMTPEQERVLAIHKENCASKTPTSDGGLFNDKQ